jgi:hypothetical protein
VMALRDVATWSKSTSRSGRDADHHYPRTTGLYSLVPFKLKEVSIQKPAEDCKSYLFSQTMSPSTASIGFDERNMGYDLDRV